MTAGRRHHAVALARLRHGALLVSLAGAACSPPAASYTVRTADVTVHVRSDGAIDVRERLTVAFHESRRGQFERRIALERADSLSFVAASVDGRGVEPGITGDTSLEVNDRRDLSARWRFSSSAGTTRVFELTYRVNGAVAVRGQRGVVRQTAIPEPRAFGIGHATVRLAVAPELHLFDGAGIAEAGWSVARTTDGIVGERAALGLEEGATLMAEVAINPAVVAEPAWQHDEDLTRDLAPAFVSGGLFILVVGGGVLWIIRFQYPRRRPGGAAPTEADAAERQSARNGLRTSGWVAIALSAVLAAVCGLTLSQFGVWPMSLPASILVVGMVFVGVAKRFV